MRVLGVIVGVAAAVGLTMAAATTATPIRTNVAMTAG
jgi:hypothetical protein